ncbi:nuclear transport factor 2 family protein [Jannaschia sp. R86511]|uniref:nuclear transport factor 2 family protein n=1 Tax=Jannaschia sp. R86511 TaxID=3093853 RepID=UPI0036D27795
MTNPTPPPSTSIPPDELPTAVRGFLTAHAVHDVAGALAHLAPDAVVTDQGETFRGAEEVRRFLRQAGSEFTYTTELVGAGRAGEDRWTAAVRIEGDFPGGVADLTYRFELRGALVAELHIGP